MLLQDLTQTPVPIPHVYDRLFNDIRNVSLDGPAHYYSLLQEILVIAIHHKQRGWNNRQLTEAIVDNLFNLSSSGILSEAIFLSERQRVLLQEDLNDTMAEFLMDIEPHLLNCQDFRILDNEIVFIEGKLW